MCFLSTLASYALIFVLIQFSVEKKDALPSCFLYPYFCFQNSVFFVEYRERCLPSPTSYALILFSEFFLETWGTLPFGGCFLNPLLFLNLIFHVIEKGARCLPGVASCTLIFFQIQFSVLSRRGARCLPRAASSTRIFFQNLVFYSIKTEARCLPSCLLFSSLF